MKMRIRSICQSIQHYCHSLSYYYDLNTSTIITWNNARERVMYLCISILYIVVLME